MNFLQNVGLEQTVKNSRLYLSLPCVVGGNGVKKIVELPFDDAELKGLLASADLLKKTLAGLKKLNGSVYVITYRKCN